jgi:hypothetical protein
MLVMACSNAVVVIVILLLSLCGTGGGGGTAAIAGTAGSRHDDTCLFLEIGLIRYCNREYSKSLNRDSFTYYRHTSSLYEDHDIIS